MYATRFGLYLGYLQACQHRKIQHKSMGPFLTFIVFVVLKYHTKYM